MKTRNPLILELDSEKGINLDRKGDNLKMADISFNLKFFYFNEQALNDKIIKIALPDMYIFGVNLNASIGYVLDSDEPLETSKYNFQIYRGKASALKLELKKNKTYEFILIGIKNLKQLLNNNQEYESLLNLKGQKSISNEIEANFKVINTLSKIIRIERKPISQLELLGHIYMIISLLIDQYVYQKAKEEHRIRKLNNWEIDVILALIFEIKTYPEKDYSLSEISNETGITIPNLQYGFKKMHNTTFAVFVRDMRLKKAAKLIRTTNLNITEIVLKIGLKSNSYFSRIFKEEYGMTPLDYRRKFDL